MPKYGFVYTCTEGGDFGYPCGWSTMNYSEIDAHEEIPGHLVIGEMRKISE